MGSVVPITEGRVWDVLEYDPDEQGVVEREVLPSWQARQHTRGVHCLCSPTAELYPEFILFIHNEIGQ